MPANARDSSISIKEIVKLIDNQEIVLPEYQRNFVWDIEKTLELFDSVIRDIFIGHIILGAPSFEITVREIDKRPRKGSGSRKKLSVHSYSEEQIQELRAIGKVKLILDGQQRITSFYRALKGIDKVWIVLKTSAELENEYGESEYKNRTLEEILYCVSSDSDEKRISISIEHVYADILNVYREAKMKELFNQSGGLEISYDDDDYEKNFSTYFECFSKVKTLLQKDTIVPYYLLNMTEDKFALFFERSNSKGITLSFIDILTAKLYCGFNLRERFENFQDDNSEYYKFKKEIIVRCISVLSSGYKSVSRKYILTMLKAEHFNDCFDQVCDGYLKVLDFLFNNKYVLTIKWMPYENMIIPLICFLLNLPSKCFSQMAEKQRSFIIYWYWASVFSQRYSGSSNEMIVLDSYVLSQIAKNKKVDDSEYFRRLGKQVVNTNDDLLSCRKGSVIYKGVLNIINFYNKGLLDWNNASEILFSNSKVEDHHIYPDKFLKSSPHYDGEVEYCDCVLNRTLIPKITNIKIGKKSPSEYLNEIKKKNPNLEKCLDSHSIFPELCNQDYDDAFELFLDDRGERILQIINFVLSKKEQIVSEFLAKKEKPIIIDVVGKFRKKSFEAKFNTADNSIWIGKSKYSPSEGAKVARSAMGADAKVAINGWQFWRYTTNSREEKFIDFLRNQ